MTALCWACRHAEAEHTGLGCRHQVRSEQVTHHDDGTITQLVDVSWCDCPYFKGSLT